MKSLSDLFHNNVKFHGIKHCKWYFKKLKHLSQISLLLIYQMQQLHSFLL